MRGTDQVDGQTAIQGILNSPIFKNYNFVSGGKNIGNTQYGDAFQRANFWDSVSGKAKNYHVLLGQPSVVPTQTIVVPDGLGHYETDFSTGLQYPVIDRDFLASQTTAILIAAQVAPTQLPIMVWGSVVAGATCVAWSNRHQWWTIAKLYRHQLPLPNFSGWRYSGYLLTQSRGYRVA